MNNDKNESEPLVSQHSPVKYSIPEATGKMANLVSSSTQVSLGTLQTCSWALPGNSLVYNSTDLTLGLSTYASSD